MIAEMENNMREKLKYVAARHPSMKVKKIADISIVDSNLPSDTFNTAFGGKIDEKSAKEIFNYYMKRKLPMAWWLGPSSIGKEAHDNLERACFTHDEIDIGMLCDTTEEIQDCIMPAGLTIRTCHTPKDFADFGDVLASIFTPADSQVKTFYTKLADIDAKKRKEMILFVGYNEIVPVATACLFLTDVAGIYDVSTRPDKRQMGYGSALFHRALVEAKQLGFKRGVLQASPDGLGIYKRFGFKKTCEFHVWGNRILNPVKTRKGLTE